MEPEEMTLLHACTCIHTTYLVVLFAVLVPQLLLIVILVLLI
jgi:hypothetical protein